MVTKVGQIFFDWLRLVDLTVSLSYRYSYHGQEGLETSA